MVRPDELTGAFRPGGFTLLHEAARAGWLSQVEGGVSVAQLVAVKTDDGVTLCIQPRVMANYTMSKMVSLQSSYVALPRTTTGLRSIGLRRAAFYIR